MKLTKVEQEVVVNSNMTNAPEFQNGDPDSRLGVTLSGFIPWVGLPISVQQ